MTNLTATPHPPESVADMSLPALAHTLDPGERKRIVRMTSRADHTPKTGDGRSYPLHGLNDQATDLAGQVIKFAFLGLVEILSTKHMTPGTYTKENPNPETGTYKGPRAHGQIYAVISRLTPRGVELARYLMEGDEEAAIDAVPLRPSYAEDVMPADPRRGGGDDGSPST